MRSTLRERRALLGRAAAGWVLAINAVLPSVAASQESIAAKLERAFARLAVRPDDALALYQEVDRESGGRSAEALIGMGVAYLTLERPQEAVDSARRAIRLELRTQQSIDAFALLGNAIYRRERAAWVLEHPKSGFAERRRAPEPPAYRLLAWKPGELAEAEAAFRKVLELTNGAANATRLSLVEVLRRLGRPAEALTLLEEHQRIEREGGRAVTTGELESCLQWASRQTSTPPEGEVVEPKSTFSPWPEYTPAAHVAGIEGQVILESIITEEGRVECVDVVKPLSHGLTGAAVQTFRRWRFRPATAAGKPVAAYFTLTVNFKAP